jgi:Domain of unknown function (DUF4388)
MLPEPTQRHPSVIVEDDARQTQPAGWTGELTLECLADLLQLLCTARTSGALHVRDARERRGCIWLEKGSIVASSSPKRGAEALYELLTWHTGTFLLDRTAHPVRYSIQRSVARLLLEGVCRHDRASGVQPLAEWTDPPTGTWQESPARRHERGILAFEAGLEKVRAKDYTGALSDWECALDRDPTNRLASSNLRRLRAVIARARSIGGKYAD